MILRPLPSRVPTRIVQGPYGSTNPATLTGRSLTMPSVPSTGPALAKEHFDDPALNRVQDKIQRAMLQIKQLPFADGQLLQGVRFLASVGKNLTHGLGSPWVGYLPLNVVGTPANFVATPNDKTDLYLIVITASSTCVADIWVYR
jgi:hypothetical protein